MLAGTQQGQVVHVHELEERQAEHVEAEQLSHQLPAVGAFEQQGAELVLRGERAEQALCRSYSGTLALRAASEPAAPWAWRR